ncbi:MarR family transcriptional regulator [Anaerotignum lactatifermentans]|uniref:MarR family transcriptional regulator n=1 Tax=Anaerotignum lactatifermentans TaxID=160404 RepID=A0ABS2G9P6_9FIRM|nr:MarR family transcriptional regulator [Anaerotignum lactatifermentans]MBM6829030.1 MarR family transcriptional regulator [Anaerotignum lactatifermentans]MBM6877363.1 MarR family transcriptional regulator [Anaerotignum lactatifermentans]MBM6950733.1 MarR family transcriptional regulator [Anaerotignum lactatifermentans]
MRYTIHASAISRYANRIYTHCLHDFPIGSGQYFFLLRIYENDGISLYALAQMGFFDKGTVSRGVQKLEEAGYIRVVPDEKDRRCRRLSVTEAAMPIIHRLLEAKEKWNQALTAGMSDEECLLLEDLMAKMVQNAKNYLDEEESE